ncbi:AMP-binding protein [Saccharolobus islandicus]|uniref:AMP-dependent synthetase and ligase n=1 Tax=Saccharolobus islandicus (strain M.16.27) TaxID=427318 RepID=C3N450_SACI3|nr:AMP-binding protein [Sulfolobus islandicus]ACP54782.1 AMP-dependent synthetase and ligase [Sulfolobus islandicus M.16.27]
MAQVAKYEIDLRILGTDDYDVLYREFRWNIPEYFNMGEAISRNKEDIAIIYRDDEGNRSETSYSELNSLSNQIANFLSELGVKRGESVGVMMGPRPETASTIVGIYKLGAIALSMTPLFGIDSANYRIQHSGAKVLLTDREDIIRELKAQIKVSFDNGNYTFNDVKKSSSSFTPVKTKSSEPAHMLYTSGTTGLPKGVVLSHAAVLAHIPWYQFVFEMAPREDDVFSQLADWGWIAGILDVVVPSLYFGKPLVAYNRGGRLDPKRVMEVLEDTKATCFFAPPTALNIIMKSVNPKEYDLKLRAIASGGSVVTFDLIKWSRESLGAPLNVGYGQTEANVLTGTNSKIMPIKILEEKRGGNLLGKPIPGHIIEIVDENLSVLPPNQVGEIAVKLPDPIVMIEYYKNPEATAKKIRGGFLLTGDLGWKDEYGYIWFKSRSDFLIKSSGYRIGPEEIEFVINQHPAVLESAVIGKEDPVRGEIIKAFIVLKPSYEPNEKLKQEIIDLVKLRLAAYAYPKEIEFVNEIPKTESGKIKRVELKRKL